MIWPMAWGISSKLTEKSTPANGKMTRGRALCARVRVCSRIVAILLHSSVSSHTRVFRCSLMHLSFAEFDRASKLFKPDWSHNVPPQTPTALD